MTNDTHADYYRRKQEEADKILDELAEHLKNTPLHAQRKHCDDCLEIERRLEAARYVGD